MDPGTEYVCVNDALYTSGSGIYVCLVISVEVTPDVDVYWNQPVLQLWPM